MLPPTHHQSEAIEAWAETFLGTTPLAQAGVAAVQTLCQGAGIDLLDADLRDIDGVLRREGGRWRIYLNRADATHRRRYMLARLLGHFALHTEIAETFTIGGFMTDGRAPGHRAEWEAGAFAAALLMPRRVIADRVTGHPVTAARVRSLADDCGVSPLAVALRLEHLGYTVPLPVGP